MTLQQLRYLIAIAASNSISAAAHRLYVSQSSLSVAVRDIERETGVRVFERSNRGIVLTPEGAELLSYARQVVEQADLMEQRYASADVPTVRRLTVSSQHYAFCIEALAELLEEHAADDYAFSLRESRTSEIIEDVREFRSDVGVLYTSSFNERALRRAFSDANLTFTPLLSTQPHALVGTDHPLAGRGQVTPEELAAYPRYAFEQGGADAFYFAEEPLADAASTRNVAVSDRGTLTSLLARGDGYTVSTGIMSSEMIGRVACVPIRTDEVMNVGYLVQNERQLSDTAQRFVEKLDVLAEGYRMACAAL